MSWTSRSGSGNSTRSTRCTFAQSRSPSSTFRNPATTSSTPPATWMYSSMEPRARPAEPDGSPTSPAYTGRPAWIDS
ncbi:hypothetical protein ACFQV8_30210 [Pseudonocardia benzenivorans]